MTETDEKKRHHKIKINVHEQNVSRWSDQSIVQAKAWGFREIDRSNQHLEKINYEKKIKEKKNQLMTSANQKKSVIFSDSKMKIRKAGLWWSNSVLWWFFRPHRNEPWKNVLREVSFSTNFSHTAWQTLAICGLAKTKKENRWSEMIIGRSSSIWKGPPFISASCIN